MSDAVQTLDTVVRANREISDATARAYARVFGADSEDMQLVRADLRRFCCADSDMLVVGAPDQTANLLGRFRVWQRIEGMVNRGGMLARRQAVMPSEEGQKSFFGDVEGVEMAPPAQSFGEAD